MRSFFSRGLAVGALALLGSTYASAILFDVVTFQDNTLSSPSIATGFSNGVGFTFSGSLWNVRTTTDDSWTGFSGSNFSPPLLPSDSLHLGVYNPTFTFDQVISSALVYISDDDGSIDSFFDFGVNAEVVSGDVEVMGTKFRNTSSSGGVVRLTGINSNVLSTVDIGDGNDFAIVVTPVPEPATMAALGLGALALVRRRRAR